MKIKNIEDIREEADYAGVRISIETIFDKIVQTLKVDVTTREDITPQEVSYSFKLMLEDRKINPTRGAKKRTYMIYYILFEKTMLYPVG